MSTRLYANNILDQNTEMSYKFAIHQKPYMQLHCHDFYEFTIVTAGVINHHINNTVQTIPCNTIIFIRPEDTHFLDGTNSEDFEYINLAFTQNTLHNLLSYLDSGFDIKHFTTAPMPPMLKISPADISAIKMQTEKLALFSVTESEKQKAYFRILIAELFFKYFHDIFEGKKEYPLWLNELLQEINKPENFRHGISQMDSLSGKTHAYISRVFKEYLQTTPTDYVNDIRLNYCANRLIHSDAEILDIAMDAGFNSISHFYHLFKKKYGITPNKYKNENMITL